MSDTILIIWVHFLSDFVLQSDTMALNKSKNNKWLGIHSLIYGLPFIYWGWKYAFVNIIFHFCVDWGTSRGTSKLWGAGKRHWFFVLIGFDQALHLTTLLISLQFFK